MRIGTRGSALALAQASDVAKLLEAHPPAAGAEDPVELITITTSGDRASRGEIRDDSDTAADQQTLPAGGPPADKSRWVDTIEAALLAGEIDLAVHSAKDVPGELAEGLELLGAPARASAADVLCGAHDLESLAEGACVGTSSLRRAAQLRAAREDLRVVAISGNVDTRLRRLGERQDLDAIVLAHAGLLRLGRAAEVGAMLDPARFVPAPGQGALALEGRTGDARAEAAVRAIADAGAIACLRAERAVASELDASCNTPLGAHATPTGGERLRLRAWVGLPDGSAWVSDELVGGVYDPEALGRRVAERMKAAGAEELLSEAGRHAPFGAHPLLEQHRGDDAVEQHT